MIPSKRETETKTKNRKVNKMMILNDNRDLRCFDFNEAADVSAKNHKFADTHVDLVPVTDRGKKWFEAKFGFGAASVRISKNGAITMAHKASEDKIKFCL